MTNGVVDGVRADPGRRAALRSTPRWRAFLVLGASLALVHATGLLGDIPMIVLSIAAPVAIGRGVLTHRPNPHWPWTLLIVAGLAWSIAGAIRSAVGSTGDLSATRDLTPDLFAILGYALFATALLWMLRAQGEALRSRSLTLDGAIMTLSAMLTGWVVLVAPILFRLDAAPIAKLSIVVYPPISAGLVSIAARLAFGTTVRGRAQNLLLAGMLALLIGDVAYIPLETQLIESMPGRLLELPYAMAYILISAGALHPSVVDTVRATSRAPSATTNRFALLAVAFLTPALMLLVWSPTSSIERVVVGTLAVGLAVSAITRVITAARGQALVEQRLAHRAVTDELTGLLNRTGIMELIDRRLTESSVTTEPIAVLFLDLDRFKLVNDSYGHAAGDELLVAVAQRLRDNIRPVDTVSRLSGDEFLIVSPGTAEPAAMEMARRVCDLFDEPFDLIGTAWIKASVGVVVAKPDQRDVDAESLLRDVDTAMYEAKSGGRNGYVVFSPEMRAKSADQLEMYNGLHRAIEHNEFEVHYQVLINADCRTVHGVEALVRWNSPDGMVPPDRFISVAEDSGLISQIGEIVLREACTQVTRWRKLPGCDDLTLSVNVSARQILDSDLVAIVANVLEESGLEPDALWLEITESVMMADTLDTISAMSGLRGLGVHLSVDDFGTGYSSLSYLHRYPIEQVKIDRQFVSGLDETAGRSGDGAVIAAVVGIADALELTVVAEGVETAWQADHLGAAGCPLLQGYYFAKPVPAIDLGPILIERNEPEQPQLEEWR